MSEQTVTLIRGDDFHCHLRRGGILKLVTGYTALQFKRALIMPNTDPPILTGQDALNYRSEVLSAVPPCVNFEPLMTIQINDYTTPDMIKRAYQAEVVAGKAYPLGVTTNSRNGVTSFPKIYPVFEKMERVGMVLSIHGESPIHSLFCLDREKMFLHTLEDIVAAFPNLKIVLEHITTKEAVELIEYLPKNVAATITVHHLLLSLNDVVGGSIEPHNFCKPVAKTPKDRAALWEAIKSGNPKFFYGGDSAPHLKEKKECAHGRAGVFNAPVALPLLVQLFEEHDALGKLEGFISVFGAIFYGLGLEGKRIELVKEDWVVPNCYNNVQSDIVIVPFLAGETLQWQVAR